MKLNDSAAHGWMVAAVAVAFASMCSWASRTLVGDLLAGMLTYAALWLAFLSGRESSRSALSEVLPYGRRFTCRTKDGKIISLESEP